MKHDEIAGLVGATAIMLESLRESMVAQAPSQDNPFRTRRSRLRRVNFMLRNAQGTAPPI